MAGETSLERLLGSLSVAVRPGRFTLVPVSEPLCLGNGVEALIREDEGTTAVVSLDAAGARGWPADFVACWLTVEAHSALDAVGLTAAVAGALARAGIPANVLAGFYHDHLLVPADRLADALACLAGLRRAG